MFNLKYLTLAFLLLISVLISLSIGTAVVDWSALMLCLTDQCATSLQSTIVWQIRLPRILAALIAGAGLAAAGAILQNATRNPLADPYLFGIVAGAGLGATIASLFSHQLMLALPLAAFLGALFAVLLVLIIGRVMQQIEQLLLAGVAVSFMLSAVSQFLLYLGDPMASNRVIFWLMGSLARVEMYQIAIMAPVVFICLILVLGFAKPLDALLLGDESAHTLGVNPNKIRLMMLAICAALTATIVAYCGGIGFVGLMVPHIARRWFGVTSASLMMGSAFIGAGFLIWVDVAARSLMPGQEIPIGVITSALGSLFFLLVLKQRRS